MYRQALARALRVTFTPVSCGGVFNEDLEYEVVEVEDENGYIKMPRPKNPCKPTQVWQDTTQIYTLYVPQANVELQEPGPISDVDVTIQAGFSPHDDIRGYVCFTVKLTFWDDCGETWTVSQRICKNFTGEGTRALCTPARRPAFIRPVEGYGPGRTPYDLPEDPGIKDRFDTDLLDEPEDPGIQELGEYPVATKEYGLAGFHSTFGVVSAQEQANKDPFATYVVIPGKYMTLTDRNGVSNKFPVARLVRTTYVDLPSTTDDGAPNSDTVTEDEETWRDWGIYPH
jgi:hypothetical protein